MVQSFYLYVSACRHDTLLKQHGHVVCGGNVIEAGIGRWKYLLFYHILGVFAGLGSLAYKDFTGSTVPTVGASGAIMGVMGILLFITIRNFRSLRRGGSRIFMLALCGVDSLYQGLYMKGVDNAAHVAGMVGGIIIGIIWDAVMRNKSKGKYINRRD